MFRAHVLIIRRSKLHYTASGIITPIGGRLVHTCALMPLHVSSTCAHHQELKLHYKASGIITPIGGRLVHTCALMPLHVSSICAHHQEVKIALYRRWYHHTYRWPSRANLCTHASTCFEHMCSSSGGQNCIIQAMVSSHL